MSCWAAERSGAEQHVGLLEWIVQRLEKWRGAADNIAVVEVCTAKVDEEIQRRDVAVQRRDVNRGEAAATARIDDMAMRALASSL